jgi:hypothetical protein
MIWTTEKVWRWTQGSGRHGSVAIDGEDERDVRRGWRLGGGHRSTSGEASDVTSGVRARLRRYDRASGGKHRNTKREVEMKPAGERYDRWGATARCTAASRPYIMPDAMAAN